MSTLSLALIVMCVVVIVVGIYEIHSLPGDIARKRAHPQAEAITVCSVLGLLVFPLWMFALVWAYAGVIGAPYPLPAAKGPAEEASPPATPVDAAGDSGADREV